jgi:hypothetical protein
MSLATLKGGINMSYAKHQYGKGSTVIDSKVDYVMFDEYVADSFEELPTEGVKIGDRAMYNAGGSLGIAVYFSTGWVKG